MEIVTDEIIRNLLASSLGTATLDENGWRDTAEGPGSHEGDHIDWLTIQDQAASVKAGVQRIKSHPLVPDDMPVYGYIYDCRTGRLVEVPE